MGHTKLSTTEKYVKVVSSEMHEAVNRNHIECIRKRYLDSKIYDRVFELSNQS
ncbi:MAG: hypothetical protein L0Y79_00315 [Chlorobi bacterium]|nr:hypothetical protein [Chlorobiota bacterium]MCI0716928.1 hypothetical protein [Chlorobiota bacterium]